MASYNVDDFDEMKQEAMERIMEMKRGNVPFKDNTHSINDEIPVHNATDNQKKIQNSTTNGLSGLLSGLIGGKRESNHSDKGAITELLDSLNIDEEKVMIGLLIYILAKNGADVKLLIGLGYLLL